MQEYIIYKIINPINQVYIGQSSLFEDRIKKYKKLWCKGQQLLYKSLIHYGFDNHIIEIIDKSVEDNLNELETYYIGKEKSYFYNNKEFGLNLTLGGKGKRGYKFSEESKKKMSESHKKIDVYWLRNIKFTEEHKRKLSNIRKEKFKKGILPFKGSIVYQYDLEGNFVKEWKNVVEVSKFLELTKSSTWSFLKINRYYICKNFKWGLKNFIQPFKKSTDEKIVSNRIPILQYDLDGNFIKEWLCMREVLEFLNIKQSTFSYNIRSGTYINSGFCWMKKNNIANQSQLIR